MGPAHSTVVNMSPKRICVITFHNSELLYFTYTAMYVIESMGSATVEAQPDAIGLQVGIVYDYIPDTKDLLFVKFHCKNDSVLSILDVDFDEVSWYGGFSKGRVKERGEVPLSMVKYVLDTHKSNSTTTESEEHIIDPSIPTKFVKDLVRRLLDREAQGSSTPTPTNGIKRSSSTISFISKSSAERMIEYECEKVSVLDKWDAEFNAMKAQTADAEAKIAQTKCFQIDKVKYVHNIAAAAILAERKHQQEIERQRRREMEAAEAERQRQKALLQIEAEKLMLAKRGREKQSSHHDNHDHDDNENFDNNDDPADEDDDHEEEEKDEAMPEKTKAVTPKKKKKKQDTKKGGGKRGKKASKNEDDEKNCVIM